MKYNVLKEFIKKEEVSSVINNIFTPGINEILNKREKKGAIINIDGSINSFVVAYLSSLAINPYWVKLIYFPCQSNMDDFSYNEEKEKIDNIKKICESIGLELDIFDITTPYAVLRNRINIHNGTMTGSYGQIQQESCEKLKKFIKSSVINTFADEQNLLVFGSLDRTDLRTFSYTKYGESAVDCFILGEFYKNEVLSIAESSDLKNIINDYLINVLEIKNIDNDLLNLDNAERGPEDRLSFKRDLIYKIINNKYNSNNFILLKRSPELLADGSIWRFHNNPESDI